MRALLLVGLLTAVWAVPAWAAPTPEGAPGEAHIRMDEVKIEGEVERPGVFYIIPRREMRMDLGALSKDYRSEILVPILPDAFRRWAAALRCS